MKSLQPLIEALQSGTYIKGTGHLRNMQDEWCCLGVTLNEQGCTWVESRDNDDNTRVYGVPYHNDDFDEDGVETNYLPSWHYDDIYGLKEPVDAYVGTPIYTIATFYAIHPDTIEKALATINDVSINFDSVIKFLEMLNNERYNRGMIDD